MAKKKISYHSIANGEDGRSVRNKLNQMLKNIIDRVNEDGVDIDSIKNDIEFLKKHGGGGGVSHDGSTIFLSRPTSYKRGDMWLLLTPTIINSRPYPQGTLLYATLASKKKFVDSHWSLVKGEGNSQGGGGGTPIAPGEPEHGYSMLLSDPVKVVRRRTPSEKAKLVEGDSSLVEGDDQLVTEVFNITTNVTVLKGSLELVQKKDHEQGGYTASIFADGLEANFANGILTVTRIKNPEGGKVRIEVTCEGKVTLYQTFSVVVIKDGVGSVGKDGKYTETRFKYSDTMPSENITGRKPSGWSLDGRSPAESISVEELYNVEEGYENTYTCEFLRVSQAGIRLQSDDSECFATFRIDGQALHGKTLTIRAFADDSPQTDLYSAILEGDFDKTFSFKIPMYKRVWLNVYGEKSTTHSGSWFRLERKDSLVCWQISATIDPEVHDAIGSSTSPQWSKPVMARDLRKYAKLTPENFNFTLNSVGSFVPSSVTIDNVTEKGEKLKTSFCLFTSVDGITWKKTQAVKNVTSLTIFPSSLSSGSETPKHYCIRKYARIYDSTTFSSSFLGESRGVFLTDGEKGKRGAIVRQRGIYDPKEIYVYNDDFRDIVLYKEGEEFLPYIIKSHGVSTQEPPTNTQYWERAVKFSFLATDTALIDGAQIAGFTLKNGLMLSKKGTFRGSPIDIEDVPAEYFSEFIPNTSIDGTKGVIQSVGSMRVPFTRSSQKWKETLVVDVSNATVFSEVNRKLFKFKKSLDGREIAIFNSHVQRGGRNPNQIIRIGVGLTIPSFEQSGTYSIEKQYSEVWIPLGACFIGRITFLQNYEDEYCRVVAMNPLTKYEGFVPEPEIKRFIVNPLTNRSFGGIIGGTHNYLFSNLDELIIG